MLTVRVSIPPTQWQDNISQTPQGRFPLFKLKGETLTLVEAERHLQAG